MFKASKSALLGQIFVFIVLSRQAKEEERIWNIEPF